MKKPARFILTGSVLLLAAHAASAQIWDGGSAVNSNIGTAANWSPDAVPANNGTAAMNFGGNARLTPTFEVPWSVSGITINNTAGAFVFGGSQLQFGLGNITNNDAQTQTFNNSVLAAASNSINALSGGLTFAGGLGIGGFGVVVNGTNTVTLASLAGSGSLTKTAAGQLIIQSSGNQIAADLILNNGTTTLSPTLGVQTFTGTSTTTVAAAASLALNANTILDGGAQLVNSGTVTLGAGTTLTLQGGSDFIATGSHTLNSGNLTITGAGSTFQGSSFLSVGAGSTLAVQAGGGVSTAGFLDVGNGSNGTLAVDGAGSTVTATGANFWGNGAFTSHVTFSSNAAGSFSAGSVEIGRSAGATAVALVLSGADVTNSGSLLLGNTTGAGADAILNVDGAGSTWSQTGSGSLTVGASSGSSSARLYSDFGGTITTSPGGTATVEKTGLLAILGGTFNATNGLNVPGGAVDIENGGVFNLAAGKTLSLTAGGNLSVAGSYSHASASTVNVSGAGSSITTTVDAEFRGGSTLNVTAGAVVNVPGSLAFAASGGNATVLVDGAGSSMTSPGSNLLWGRNGGTAAVTFSNNATGTFAGGILAGDQNGSAATISVQSGADLSVGGLLLSNVPYASTSAMTVDGAGSTVTLSATAQLVVGSSSLSAATLTLSNGGSLTMGSSGFALVDSTGTLAIPSGTFTATNGLTLYGQMTLGSTGSLVLPANRSLDIYGGGDFAVTGTYTQSAFASINVSGAGSTFTTTSNALLYAGALWLADGGSATVGGTLAIGSGFNGQLTVQGEGTVFTASGASFGSASGSAGVMFSNKAAGNLGAVSVGTDATGTVQVLGGAHITSSDIALESASFSGNGSITISDAGSAWTQSGSATTTIANEYGFGGVAALKVLNGGTFTSGTGQVTLNSAATVTINGGTVNFNGPLVNNGGHVVFTSGALNLVSALTIGTSGLIQDATGPDVELLTNRRLTTTGTTTIDAFRTLALSGGTFRTGALVNNGAIAFNSGTLGITGAGGLNIGTGGLGANVTLSAGRTLEVTNALAVASGASLTMDGGTLTAGSLTNAGQVEHSRGALSIAEGVVNQAGANFVAAKPVTVGGGFVNAGGARLSLEGGTGRITGAGTFSNAGLVTGDGTIGITFNNNSGGEVRGEAGKTLYFTGSAGTNTGRLNLQGGTLDYSQPLTNLASGQINGHGALHFPTAPVPATGSPAAGLNNSGQINLSGGDTQIYGTVAMNAGSKLIVSGGATASFYDVFRHNGAEVRASTGAAIAFFGEVRGAGGFTGGGTVQMEGGYSPGNSPASVPINTDLILGSTNVLTMELGGLVSGRDYDQLSIGSLGSLRLDGSLLIQFTGAFLPESGQSFQLFDFTPGQLTGTFAEINLARPLPGNLKFDFGSLYTLGRLSVVPEPGSAALLATALLLITRRRRA